MGIYTLLQTVVRATEQVSGQWKMAILGCQNSITPEPIDSKFGVYDYISDLIACAKFRKI